MRFDPLSDQQIAEEEAKRQPLPPGTYDCEITDAEDSISKAGNDMIALTMRVYGPDGSYRTVRDWLLPTLPAKFKRAAQVFGLDALYEAGRIEADDFRGRPGRVTVKIERDAERKYPDKNVVQAYPAPANNAEAHAAQIQPKTRVEDDDIPF